MLMHNSPTSIDPLQYACTLPFVHLPLAINCADGFELVSTGRHPVICSDPPYVCNVICLILDMLPIFLKGAAHVFLTNERAIRGPEGRIVGYEGVYFAEVPTVNCFLIGFKKGFKLMPQLYLVVYGNSFTLFN